MYAILHYTPDGLKVEIPSLQTEFYAEGIGRSIANFLVREASSSALTRTEDGSLIETLYFEEI